MHWLVTAAVGDVPIAILACAGLLLGVWAMARGRGSDAADPPTPSDAPPAPAAVLVVAPAAARDEPPATTFRQGTIRLGRDRAPAPQAEAAAAAASEPEAQSAPSQPAPAPLPQVPPTGFRQGRIRVGGLERGWKRDP